MREVDYIVVGLGLAGIAFCEQLEAAGKSFLVYDNGGASASLVAAGLYNPVILKRYTLPWKAIEQFDLALPHFRSLEQKLNTRFVHSLPVRKVFSSVEDQNNWFSASDKPGLSRFISPHLSEDSNEHIVSPYHFGEVQETGRIDIPKLKEAYKAHLEGKNAFAPARSAGRKADFYHTNIQFTEDQVIYEGYTAKHIVFAEGFGIKNNPYFNGLPLVGNKGEYIIIKAPALKLTAAIKTSFFIVPLGDDVYKVGATFNWTDKDTLPSKAAKEELIEKLSTLMTCDYEIVDHTAGMRPTTGDRRALLGTHPTHPQLALLNGLGTRGIMASPLLAKYLFDNLENGKDLPEEVNLLRFASKL